MKLPAARWQQRPGLKPLLGALGADQGMTRYVGGCVRDTLLGLETNDIDLATRLLPEDVMARLQAAGLKAIPTGIAHGTVTAISAGMPAEVTTLRRDVSTDGRRATVAFTEDWREDAGRRDFTINALSADPITGEIFDYFGGLDDAKAHRVRFIGDPRTRIAEDHLRILRFFRFEARFGKGEPDPEGLAACTARANDLMALSRERVADELLKLLALPDPVPTVRIMLAQGICAPILPEIDASGIARLDLLCRREREFDVAPAALRRLAALLPPDVTIAADVGARFRLSNKAVKRLVAAAGTEHTGLAPQQLAYWLGSETAIDRLLLGDGNPRSLAGHARPSFDLTGGELIAMGLPPGPLVARTRGEIERQWVAEDFPDRERLSEIARAAVAQALRSSQ